MEHSFDIDVAKEIGVKGAILLKNIYFWVCKNEANNKHFADRYYWTYNSIKAFNELFPYITEKQIRSTLTNLEEDGYIITGNYNKSSYDRTKWYAITEKGKCLLLKGQMENTKKENENVQKGKPIPDIKTNNKNTNIESVEQSSTIPYDEIINYLNSKANTNFRSTSKDNQKYIRARWNDGFRLENFFNVIDIKVSEWKNDTKMAPYLRPSTLFGTKFESYLQQFNAQQKTHKKEEAISIPVSKEDKAKNSDGSYVVF
jgi:uncharacterized phage protein (TIGR02220 family)